MRIVTLTTDFGPANNFAGVVKGVILSLAPRVRPVDLTHSVPAGDVRAAAWELMTAWRFFPRGTVHVAVVDPGVGGPRRALAVRAGGHLFVGPDNGVLSWAAPRPDEAVEIGERYRLSPVSRTFHGRDVFAPAAAALAAGVPLRRLGARVGSMVRIPFPAAVRTGLAVKGEVVALDTFGNAATSVPNAAISALGPSSRVRVEAGGRRIPLASAYCAVRRGAPVAVPGSAGFLELAVRDGSAARLLRLRSGSSVVVRRGRR